RSRSMQYAVPLAWHIGAEPPSRAGSGSEEPHDHGDGGGLAGAVSAQQACDGTDRQRKGDAIDGHAALIDFHKPLDGYGGGWHKQKSGGSGQGSGKIITLPRKIFVLTPHPLHRAAHLLPPAL